MKKILKSFIAICCLLSVTSCANIYIQKLNNIATEKMKAEDFDGAIARFISINDLNPNLYNNYYNLGMAYYKKNDYEKATDSFVKSINLKSDFPEAYYMLALIHDDLSVEIKENNSKELTEEAKKALSEHLTIALENYTNYLKISSTASDAEEILSRSESIKYELEKLNAELKK